MWGVFSGRVGWRKPLVMSVSWKIQGVKFWDLGDILVGDVPEAEKVVRSIGCGVSFIGKLGAETHFCTQIGFLVAGSRDGICDGIPECRLPMEGTSESRL